MMKIISKRKLLKAKNLLLQQRMKKNLMMIMRMDIRMIDIPDHHRDHHQEEKHVVVVDDIEIIVDIPRHQVHGLPLQAHRLIVHVHHQVVHIEDIDVDDHVSF